MIKYNKVKYALENKWQEDGVTLSAKDKIEKIFGVQEHYEDVVDDRGNICRCLVKKTIDPQAVHDLDNIGPAAFAREVMGSGYQSEVKSFLSRPNGWVKAQEAMEEVAPGVSASMMTPINTWASFTLGLFDVKIIEGYDFNEAIYEQLIPERPTAIHAGSKNILSDYDGTVDKTPVSEFQPATQVGMKPYWVWSRDVEEFHQQTVVSQEELLSDISGGLQRQAVGMGQAAKKVDNYRGIRYLCGYTNQFAANTNDNSTPSCNTYQSSAGSAPFEFVNLYFSSPLTDVDSLYTAWVNMRQLYDPVRGWRLDIGKKFKLLAAPGIAGKAAETVKQIASYRATQTGFSPTGTNQGRVGEAASLLMLAGLEIEVIDFGQEFLDTLTNGADQCYNDWTDYLGNHPNTSNLNPLTARADAPGVPGASNLMSTTQSAGIWFLMSEKRPAVVRETWVPLKSTTYPLTGQDLERRIGLRADVYRANRFVTLEPRMLQANLPAASGS